MKLLPSFQPYYDVDQCSYVLLGHADPLLLPDPSTFREVIDKGIATKATKVHFIFHISIATYRFAILASSLDITSPVTLNTYHHFSGQIH
jgi:hypothetical protein